VETVAENTSDGIIAPLLFLAIGTPLAVWYKAVNTLDSMVGYKNETYRLFGKASARLDDAANFLPARLAGLLMIIAAPLVGLNGKKAWQIFRRDRSNHASPNSAQTEAACAGALGIRLGGTASYFGQTVAKPTIGDADRAAEPADISRAHRLMIGASLLCLVLVVLVRGVIAWL
jgi:adenosylcobinamide-phosphate synthase